VIPYLRSSQVLSQDRDGIVNLSSAVNYSGAFIILGDQLDDEISGVDYDDYCGLAVAIVELKLSVCSCGRHDDDGDLQRCSWVWRRFFVGGD